MKIEQLKSRIEAVLFITARAVSLDEIAVILGEEKETIEEILKIADAAVVGTTFKYDGKFENQTDVNRVKEFMRVVKAFRS